MRKKLPRTRELCLFVAIALVSAVIVGLTGKHDVGLAVVGAPLFLVASLMGLRRSTEADRPATDEAIEAEEPAA